MREIVPDVQLRRDMASLLRHALEKSHKLDPCHCSPCEKIAELAGADIIERACGQGVEVNQMTDKQIKHMVSRFLSWRLPENFNPDAGISFKKTFNEQMAHPMHHEPVGTNLFDATQAEMMVRYMVDGMAEERACGQDEVCGTCGLAKDGPAGKAWYEAENSEVVCPQECHDPRSLWGTATSYRNADTEEIRWKCGIGNEEGDTDDTRLELLANAFRLGTIVKVYEPDGVCDLCEQPTRKGKELCDDCRGDAQ